MKTIHDEFGISRDLHEANATKRTVDLRDLTVNEHNGQSGSERGFLVPQFVNLIDLEPTTFVSFHGIGLDSNSGSCVSPNLSPT